MPVRKDSELKVITSSRDLTALVFSATENSPKKFRSTIVNRMINLAFDVTENLVLANETRLGVSPQENEKRRAYQHIVLAKLRVLDVIVLVAREQGCVLPKQYVALTEAIADCVNLTGAWISSDNKRITGSRL